MPKQKIEIVEVSGDIEIDVIKLGGEALPFVCNGCGNDIFRRVRVGNGTVLQYQCQECNLVWYGSLVERKEQDSPDG